MRRVVPGEIGAHHLPARAAVGREVHVLAAHVHAAVIVRRDHDGEGPVPAVLQVGGPPPVPGFRPDAHVTRVTRAHVVDLEPPVVASGPDGHVVHGVRDAESALAAPHVLPRPFRDAVPQAAARHAIRGAVLAVAVHEVRRARVDVHVVHLGDRQHDAHEGPAAVERDARPAVVRHHEAVGIQRIDPDVVVVAAAFVARAGQRAAAVARHAEAHRDEVQPLLVVGRDGEAHVVRRALRHAVIVAHHVPGRAPVIAPIERGILVLDQRVDGVRVRRSDRHCYLAHDVARVGEAVPRDALPRRAAVSRHPQPAPRPAALEVPGLHLELPHAGEYRIRVARIEGEVRAAGVGIDEQHAGPRLAAVGGAVHAAVLGRPVRPSQRAHQHHIGVRGMDHDARDASRAVEPLVLPAAPRVGRAIHPVAQRRGRADEEGLARACPEHVVRRRRQRHRADRLRRLAVEHRAPVHAAVFGLPDAARRGSDVGYQGVAGLSHHRHRAVALGAHEAVPQARPQRGVDLLGSGGGDEQEERCDYGENASHA